MVRAAGKSSQGKDSQDVVILEMSEDAIVSIDSYEQALALVNNNGGIVEIGEVAGDGYVITKDKDILLNIPFLLIDWKEVTDPETLRDYATIRLITSDGRKYRLSDGSTGIYKQLTEIRDRTGFVTGIRVPKGLTKSEYYIRDDTREPVGKDFDGPKSKAATYYLSTTS